MWVTKNEDKALRLALFCLFLAEENYADAMALCERVQAILEEALGSDLPFVADSLKTRVEVLVARVKGLGHFSHLSLKLSYAALY